MSTLTIKYICSHSPINIHLSSFNGHYIGGFNGYVA